VIAARKFLEVATTIKRKRPPRFLLMAVIYVGDDLLSHTLSRAPSGIQDLLFFSQRRSIGEILRPAGSYFIGDQVLSRNKERL
jgi:hypothetical protein